MFKSGLCGILVVGHWQRNLSWNLDLRVIRIAGSHQIMHPAVPLVLRRRGAMKSSVLDVLQSTTLSTSSLSVLQVGTVPQFMDHWRSITSCRFVLKMVEGHHLQLRYHSLLFCNFKWFNFKDATAHHPDIQKEVDVLLTKSTIEPWTGSGGFYSNVFVVPRHTGGLWPIIILKNSDTICTYLLLIRHLLSNRKYSQKNHRCQESGLLVYCYDIFCDVLVVGVWWSGILSAG